MHSLQSSACQAPESWFMVWEAGRWLCKLNFILFFSGRAINMRNWAYLFGPGFIFLYWFILFCFYLFIIFNIFTTYKEYSSKEESYTLSPKFSSKQIYAIMIDCCAPREKISYCQSLMIFVIQHCLDASFTYGTADWNFKPSYKSFCPSSHTIISVHEFDGFRFIFSA